MTFVIVVAAIVAITFFALGALCQREYVIRCRQRHEMTFTHRSRSL